MKTSKGYQIAYLNRCTYQTQGFEGFSGRVRVVSSDPYYDQIVKWDVKGNAIDHEYGAIVQANLQNEVVTGFDIFSCLVKQPSNKQSL